MSKLAVAVLVTSGFLGGCNSKGSANTEPGGGGAGAGGGATTSSSGSGGPVCPEPQQTDCAHLLDCCNAASFPAIPAQSVCRGLVSGCSSMCSSALSSYLTDGYCSVPDGGFPDGSAPDAAAPGCPLGFSPSNIAGADLCDHFPAPFSDVVVHGTCSFEGTSSSTTCAPVGSTIGFVEVAQGANLPKIGVYVAKSWTFAAGANVTFAGPNAIALVATDTIDVEGTLSMTADGTGTTAGGYFTKKVGKGAGPGGGGAGSTTNAGGGGGYCGPGGKGSAFGGGTESAGGSTWGNAKLIPLVGGASGGSADGVAGSGGGALQLVANARITVGTTGVITAGGGSGAIFDGAGSGGGILIEAPTVTLDGILAANGGGGGGEGTNFSGSDGTATTTPAAPGTNGGKGSAGTTLVGSDGQCPAASCVSTNTADAPGAGGGGAGWIRVNTKSGAATLGGTYSPAMSTRCATQGKITP